MIDIVMDVDDSALCLLIEALHNLRMKDILGENMETAVSYVKVFLLLLQNFPALPTNTMGLLNNGMVSAGCDDFTNYMKIIYFASKLSNTVSGYMEYLDLAEAEYRIIYRKNKWLKALSISESAFIGDNDSIKGCGRTGHS